MPNTMIRSRSVKPSRSSTRRIAALAGTVPACTRSAACARKSQSTKSETASVP